MYLGVIFFFFYLPYFVCVELPGGICGLVSSIHFGKFSAINFLNIASDPFSHLNFWDSNDMTFPVLFSVSGLLLSLSTSVWICSSDLYSGLLILSLTLSNYFSYCIFSSRISIIFFLCFIVIYSKSPFVFFNLWIMALIKSPSDNFHMWIFHWSVSSVWLNGGGGIFYILLHLVNFDHEAVFKQVQTSCEALKDVMLLQREFLIISGRQLAWGWVTLMQLWIELHPLWREA